MFRILVVEDDKALNKSICSFLRQRGYTATGCVTVSGAYEQLYSNVFDLIISDIMMSETDGYEFAESIRATDKEIPILFISARDDLYSKQKGYSKGIDDYMVKPLSLEELILRIEALLRRSKIATSKKLTAGSFTMNMDERTAVLEGREIPMTAREFNILYKLLSYPNKAFTRSQLMEEFWEADTSSSPRTVDIYMAKIRDKLSDCSSFEIATVHGLGYKVVLK